MKNEQAVSDESVDERISNSDMEKFHTEEFSNFYPSSGIEGVVRGLKGIHLGHKCVLTKLD
jgi:hypothetical protein